MANKSLTIDVLPKSVQTGSLDNWSQLGNTTVFIKDIITPKLDKKTNIGQLVSGIPTAFARVDLFKTALDHIGTNGMDTDSKENNLVSYYTRLVDEWRGFIACMALDYAYITVRRIDLKYSDGKPISKTANVYEPKGAFGNMLLRRTNRWCDQNLPDSAEKIPHINVIKYRDTVVGAAAPESLLFTSTGYKCEPSPERPWIDPSNGKFTDPLRSNISPAQLSSLRAYVQNLINGLQNAQQYYASLPQGEGVDYTSIRAVLRTWLQEIDGRADRDGVDTDKASIPPVSGDFGGPFQELFCHNDILHGLEGDISELMSTGSVEFDPNNLLLNDSARIAKLNLKIKPEELPILPILVMQANIKGMNDKAYFALPLSALGLNVFGKNVAALVGMAKSSAIQSSLRATYDPNAKTNNLEVELNLVTREGGRRQLKKIYTCGDKPVDNSDILIWPNFVSPQWNAYYMYSELPHNGITQDYRAYPFVGEMQDDYFRIIVDKDKNPVLLSNDGKITVPDNEAELLIQSGENVANNPYKYEIYHSTRPFKGVRLQSPTGKEGGYLLINYSSDNGTQLPHDWMKPGAHTTLQPVCVGVDFGSTNTSVAYSSDATGEKGFEFENQRVSLMGYELPGRPNVPRESQVFFFQGSPDKNKKVKSNAVKSVLTLHDNNRMPEVKTGETVKMRNERAVVGGFPSFSDNLPFSGADQKKIILDFPNGIGQVTQIHNMKWEDNDEDKAHKSAFLRTLMLHVYGTLFAQGLVPDRLKWSYPSAMMGHLLLSYQDIWNSLCALSPVLDDEGKRIPLNVSQYTDARTLGNDMSTPFGSDDQGAGNAAFGNDSFGSDSFGSDSFSGFGGDNGVFGNNSFGSFGDNAFGQETPKPDVEVSVNPKDFIPDDPEAPISYDPKPFYDNTNANPSLSEAEAVANFISVKYGKEANVLNLVFDVGGSTTDISALFFLKGNVTMIKQNSLRFAAQRVSQSVSRFPRFKRVLSEICGKYNIKMIGLNVGRDTYNESTAPYFFDQIVNRLSSAQLVDLYRNIAANCPQLMCVNLYVTGLLMYYAGEVAHKLIDDLKRTPDTEWPAKRRPKVRVTFAGKGSRLFQWLATNNPKAAREYYGGMFVKGYGEKQLKESLADWQEICLPALDDAASQIKYEVSMGLAKDDTDLQRPASQQAAEIIGESGFDVVGTDNVRRSLEFTNSISPAMLQSVGVRFAANPDLPQGVKFTEFCSFFYAAARQLFNWQVNPSVLNDGCRNLNITAYVQNMPEFRTAMRDAQSGNPFSFVAPVIILEGMKFYETTLLNLLSKQ